MHRCRQARGREPIVSFSQHNVVCTVTAMLMKSVTLALPTGNVARELQRPGGLSDARVIHTYAEGPTIADVCIDKLRNDPVGIVPPRAYVMVNLNVQRTKFSLHVNFRTPRDKPDPRAPCPDPHRP